MPWREVSGAIRGDEDLNDAGRRLCQRESSRQSMRNGSVRSVCAGTQLIGPALIWG
jgi:hypothetical protein